MSNLVLNGSRTVASLQFSARCADIPVISFGVPGSVVTINPGARTVTLAAKTVLAYAHLVLAPGVSWRTMSTA